MGKQQQIIPPEYQPDMSDYEDSLFEELAEIFKPKIWKK